MKEPENAKKLMKLAFLKKEETKEPEKVILFHTTPVGVLAFDVLVKKGIKGYDAKELGLYRAEECVCVQKWMEEHKDYEYIGSDDFGHIWGGPTELIERLKREGFTVLMCIGDRIF